MGKLSENALKIAEDRYFMENEDWEKCSARVGEEVASVENGNRSKYESLFSAMIYDMDFLPGGRILRNARRARGSMFNCYVVPVGDSIEEIGQWKKDTLILWSEGGGVGCNVSSLRPRGALVKGKGEMVTPLPPLPHTWAVLMVPPVPRVKGKTGRLYASLEASHYTDGQITNGLVALLTGGEEVTLPTPLFNVFDSVAARSFAGLGGYQEQFLKAGAREVHLAGSGPTLFTLLKDRVWAEEIYWYLQQKGLESYLAETLAVID